MLELAQGLTTIAYPWRLWAGRHDNAMLRQLQGEPVPPDAIVSARAARHLGRLAGGLVNEPGFSRYVRRQHLRVVHRTYYPVADMLGHGCRTVETLHDMWDEQAAAGGRPGLKSRLKRRALQRADQIVCVSESTRREMARFWPELIDKAVVIPHGAGPLSTSPVPAGRNRPFFLFVGRRDLYKNFEIAVRALAASPALAEHELICFGGGSWSEGESARLRQLTLAGRVHQFGGSDDRLAGLYQSAVALLYPSRYEGFGLPLLEAMIHQCPVIAAPLTSLPEVGGDAAVYADADDVDAWRTQMEAIALSPSTAAQLRQAGLAQAARFSWERTARAHAEIYDRLA